jgi:hypothetical protein
MAPPLGDVLDRLIADADGIRPDQVTEAHILKQRETKIYPRLRYNIPSEYGGYDLTGLEVNTRSELNEREARVDAAAARLVEKQKK